MEKGTIILITLFIAFLLIRKAYFQTASPQVIAERIKKIMFLNGSGDIVSLNPVPLKGCDPGYRCTPRHVCDDGAPIQEDNNKNESLIEQPRCRSLEVCCFRRRPEEIVTKQAINNLKIETKIQCGTRNLGGAGFKIINNGEYSQPGEFPWVVGIVEIKNYEPEYKTLELKCGGSLVSPSAIITAAHCIHNKEYDQLLVLAGEYDTQTDAEPFERQQRSISKIITHPEFYRPELLYDVAIIFTKKPFELFLHIQPICLPTSVTMMSLNGQNCVAIGWGKNEFGAEGIYQVRPRIVDLPVIESEECQKRFRDTQLGPYFELHETFLCAGGIPGKDTCKGDGGSPLMCESPNHENRYYLAGIVSWGLGCGTTIPGAYVNVSYLENWIEKTLQENSVNSSYYTLV